MSCHQQGHAGSKTFFQQNPLVLNWGCWLTQAVLHNEHKTAVVVVVVVVLFPKTTTFSVLLTFLDLFAKTATQTDTRLMASFPG